MKSSAMPTTSVQCYHKDTHAVSTTLPDCALTLALRLSTVLARSALSFMTCSNCVLDCSHRTCQARTSSALFFNCLVFYEAGLETFQNGVVVRFTRQQSQSRAVACEETPTVP